MKNLIEVGKIVTKKKVRKIEIFDDHSLRTKNSKFNEFYEALMADKFKNDRDAATFLYGCSPTDDKYRQLKSRFRKRLLNTLFFLDVNLPATSSYDRAYYSCNKDWTLVKILLSNHADNTAQNLARQILNTALRYQFADVIVNCGRILRDGAARRGDEKGFDEYDAHIKAYTPVVDAEMRSEELLQRVRMYYDRTSGPDTHLPARIDAHCEALVGLSELHDSPVILYNMYLAWTYRFDLLRDYPAMLETGERAEAYIEAHPRYYRAEKLATFQLHCMYAYLHLDDFARGRERAEKCLTVFTKGSAVWFDFLELYFLLAVRTRQYIQAVAIYQRATGNNKFRKLDLAARERWKVYDVYQHYLIEAYGKEYPVLVEQRRKPFRLNRFLQEPLLYPKHLRPLSVHMTILQVLFLLENRKWVAAAERVDHLRSYANRQLKREQPGRLLQFIRNFQQLARAEFRVERLPDVDELTDKLAAYPFVYRGRVGELEVIPYEEIWAIALRKGQPGAARRRQR